MWPVPVVALLSPSIFCFNRWSGQGLFQWRGFTTIGRLRASKVAKLLVMASGLCSRPGDALLKSAANNLDSRETPNARRTY